MSSEQQTHNPPDPPPPDDPPRLPFWRRGSRRASEPPPPIWELPELYPPSLWTRFKQRADRWLGQTINERAAQRRREDAARPSTPAPGQEPRASRTRTRRQDTAQVRPPAASVTTSQTGDQPARPDEDTASPLISAAVLESAYEAVRQGRIGDPATIREIAARFARITPDTAYSDDLGFDPQEAVRALRQRAVEIARARGIDDHEDDPSASQSQARSGETGAPRAAQRRPEPHIERDENITRGG